MGRLVIDGSCVYEIDEDCVRRHRPSRDCGIYEYLQDVDGMKKSDNSKNDGLQDIKVDLINF